jgi:D-alanyl-D-alanine carboxypeptidase
MTKPLKGLSGLLFPVLFALVPMPDSKALARRGISDLTADGLPNIQSVAALVVDLQSGTVLYERDADSVRPIASISKVVGALVFHEECKVDPTQLHEMTTKNRDAAKGGDKSKLTTGWSYSVRDLLHAALMRSDNRALPALGEACGMDPQRFGEKMTERVRKLGLTRTFFREPNGLSPDNVSTAREVLVFLREVVKYPELATIMATQEHVITAHKSGKTREIKIKNTDRLLSKDLATIMGGKTGYTDLARYCFTVAARMKDNRELGMVFLGAEGRHTRFADFTRVVRWLYPTEEMRMLAEKAAKRRQAKSARGLDTAKAEGAKGDGAGAATDDPEAVAKTTEPHKDAGSGAAPAVEPQAPSTVAPVSHGVATPPAF